MENSIEISMINIEKIKPYENNPRINDDAVEAVAKSIKSFGFKSPIIVDKDLIIIAGHTRLKAAEKLGLKQVPTVIATNLTKKQAKALRIADNKTGELAEWDISKLVPELKDLKSDDFDMSSLGFSEFELASMLNPTIEDDGQSIDDYEEPEKKEEHDYICPECGFHGKESDFKV